MVLSLLALHSKVKDTYKQCNGYGSYFGFVDLRVQNEIDIYFKNDTSEGNTFLIFSRIKRKISSGKVDVYKITHFKRLLKQILGNSQLQ